MLAFIPISSIWVWVLDSRWKSVFQRLFPDCVIIYGDNYSLPAVDILLLSRVLLHGCVVNLKVAPFSLMVTTTSNTPVSSEWKKLTWNIHHIQVGGGTTSITNYIH